MFLVLKLVCNIHDEEMATPAKTKSQKTKKKQWRKIIEVV